MRVDILKLAKLIDELTVQRDNLKKNKDLLEEIKNRMNLAWEDDTRWEEEGRPVVTRIISSTEEMITLFSNTIVSLESWLERIKIQMNRRG